MQQLKTRSDYVIKVIIIGNSSVGKSCILMRYVDDEFTTSFISTIGIDFKIKTVEVDGLRIKVQLWDTAGQERFQSITQAYYRGAMGVIIVYDVTNRETFDKVRQWMNSLNRHTDNIPKLIIGNKIDLRDTDTNTETEKNNVREEDGNALAFEYDCKFIEVSAKRNYKINEAFTTIIRDTIGYLQNRDTLGKTTQQDIIVDAESNKSTCCL